MNRKILIASAVIFPVALSLFIFSCLSATKESTVKFNADTFVPPYQLPVPENWTTERFAIPIDFAPSIRYAGIEEVRFAPGWSDPATEDYWTYSYLWYLDGKITFNAHNIEQNMEAYYSGLIERNIERREIEKGKLFPANATVMKIETYDGDLSTFRGTVEMVDYMAHQPMTLHVLIHVKECEDKDNTFVFYEVSPQPETHSVWNTLNEIWSEFQCDVK